ncbi:MAG TPA: hypothetical protein DEF02_01915 [Clostridiales bacterium]|nr:hypothetical protein [Clostridiales bacterium]HBW05337.1 hypothetical protein [Clostridiales bacterium]
MKDKFSANSRLWSVRHCREFASFKKYVVNPRNIAFLMQVYRIKDIKIFYPIDVDATVKTLNEMKNRVDEGQNLYYALDGKDVGIYPFIIGDNKPFVLVLPGGGYGDVCSLVEGYSTALRLNEMGYNAFVGQYSVGKNAHYPNPQDDVAQMLKYVFDNAKNLSIDTKNYAVCGFSAGGHLAASWGTKTIGYEKYGLPKPKALFLAYPVITMGAKTHKGSRKKLLGENCNDVDMQAKYSIEKQVNKDYPATFIWQCKSDTVVSFANSVMLVDTLKKCGCKCEFMPVDDKVHGWGLANNTPAQGWLERAVELWQER